MSSKFLNRLEQGTPFRFILRKMKVSLGAAKQADREARVRREKEKKERDKKR
jgi:hypothetical protein